MTYHTARAIFWVLVYSIVKLIILGQTYIIFIIRQNLCSVSLQEFPLIWINLHGYQCEACGCVYSIQFWYRNVNCFDMNISVKLSIAVIFKFIQYNLIQIYILHTQDLSDSVMMDQNVLPYIYYQAAQIWNCVIYKGMCNWETFIKQWYMTFMRFCVRVINLNE